MEGNWMNELKSCGNNAPSVAREMCIREKIDRIYDIVAECYGLTNSIDARLYAPKVCVTESESNCRVESIEDKLQVMFSSVTNMCDSLRSINDKL
jgi:hypothetical protein